MRTASLVNSAPVTVTAVPPVVLPVGGEIAETLSVGVSGAMGDLPQPTYSRGAVRMKARQSTGNGRRTGFYLNRAIGGSRRGGFRPDATDRQRD